MIILRSLTLLTILFCVGCHTNTKSANVSKYLPIIRSLSNQGNWREAIEIAKIHLFSIGRLSVKDKIVLYVVLGENYRLLEEYEAAEENFKKVIGYSESDKRSAYLGAAYYGLGDLYYLKWNYFKQEDALDQAKIYLDSSMVYAKEGSHRSLESKVLYRLGTIHQIQGNQEKSVQCFEKGFEISFSISDTAGIIRNDIHKAADLESVGMLDSALFRYTRAYEYAKEIDRNYAEAHALCNLGLFYFDRGDVALAKDYFTKAEFLSEELNHRIVLCRSYHGLSLTEEKLGNTSKAIELANNGLVLAKEKGYKNYEHAFTALLDSLN